MSSFGLANLVNLAIRVSNRHFCLTSSNCIIHTSGFSETANQSSQVLLPKQSLVQALKDSVLFENDKIICVNKPAGVHGYKTKFKRSNEFHESLTVQDVLPQLAKDLGCESLRVCHAPHPLYSGATILAKSDETASILRNVFKLAKRRLEYIRTDIALTIGVPSPRRDLINVPVEKREVNGKIQALPILNPSKAKLKQKNVKNRLTQYNVLDSSHGMALVELQPRDGLGQLSLLHITCKMCQVLGDQEYSHRIVRVGGVSMLLDADKVETGTQKLTPRIKHLLDITDRDMQDLPMHIHRWKLSLPCNHDLGLPVDTVITAPLPTYFSRTLKRLGMQT